MDPLVSQMKSGEHGLGRVIAALLIDFLVEAFRNPAW